MINKEINQSGLTPQMFKQHNSEMEGWRDSWWILKVWHCDSALAQFCWLPEVFELLGTILTFIALQISLKACNLAHIKPSGKAPCLCIMTLNFKNTFALSPSLTCFVAVVSGGGRLPVCAACKQRIYDEQYLQALNSDWHAICFRYVV